MTTTEALKFIYNPLVIEIKNEEIVLSVNKIEIEKYNIIKKINSNNNNFVYVIEYKKYSFEKVNLVLEKIIND